MPNIDMSALLALLHAKSPWDLVHVALETVGGAALLWQFAAPLIPKATLWLLPWASRAGAAVALWFAANPITGPVLRRPENRDKIVTVLHQLLDMLTKLATAFEIELERDIAAAPPAPPAPAAAPAPPAASAAGGAPSA